MIEVEWVSYDRDAYEDLKNSVKNDLELNIKHWYEEGYRLVSVSNYDLNYELVFVLIYEKIEEK